MPRQYRLSTASAYSIYEMYAEDWSDLPQGHEHEGKLEECASECKLGAPLEQGHARSEQQVCFDKAGAQESTTHPCKPRLCDWTVEDVVLWSLTTTLSPEVGSWLRKHEVSGAVLRTLEEAELAALGLEPLGRRRQLLLLREQLLAEDAAKEKKANSPRTGPALAAKVSTRPCAEKLEEDHQKLNALKCNKGFEPSPRLPTPLRSLLKPGRGLQEVSKQMQPDLKMSEHDPYELQDWTPKSAGTELTLPASEVTLAPTSRSMEAVTAASTNLDGLHPAHRVVEGIQSLPRCGYVSRSPSQQGSSLAGGHSSVAGRAISWKPAAVPQSFSPSAAARGPAGSRHISWMPATAQEATSISLKVVRQASWAPAIPLASGGMPRLETILEAKAQAWARALAQASQNGYASLRGTSQSRTSSRRIIGYSVTIRPRSSRSHT